MRIAGNYTFEATREEVWSALNDPEVLARTIPGCQRLDQVGENEYESTLKIGLQAVRGVYNGRVKIDTIVPPESYTLHVDGKGNNGFLKGAGTIKLRPDGVHTILDYGGEAQVGGTIASVGQRLLDGAARTLINQSLKALAQQIEERRLAQTPEHAAEVQAAVIEEAEHVPIPGAGPDLVHADTVVTTATTQANGIAPNTVVSSPPLPEVTFSRRTITVPAGEVLSETQVAHGVVEDFFKERPWAPWIIVAFLLGYLLGRRY